MHRWDNRISRSHAFFCGTPNISAASIGLRRDEIGEETLRPSTRHACGFAFL